MEMTHTLPSFAIVFLRNMSALISEVIRLALGHGSSRLFFFGGLLRFQRAFADLTIVFMLI